MRHIRREFPGWMKLPRRGNRSCAGNQGIDFRHSISGFRFACIRLCEITPRGRSPQGLKPACLMALDGTAEGVPSQSDFGARYVLAASGEFNKQLFKKSKTLQKRSLLR